MGRFAMGGLKCVQNRNDLPDKSLRLINHSMDKSLRASFVESSGKWSKLCRFASWKTFNYLKSFTSKSLQELFAAANCWPFISISNQLPKTVLLTIGESKLWWWWSARKTQLEETITLVSNKKKSKQEFVTVYGDLSMPLESLSKVSVVFYFFVWRFLFGRRSKTPKTEVYKWLDAQMIWFAFSKTDA